MLSKKWIKASVCNRSQAFDIALAVRSIRYKEVDELSAKNQNLATLSRINLILFIKTHKLMTA